MHAALRQSSACAVLTEWRNQEKLSPTCWTFTSEETKVLAPLMPPEV